MDQAKPHTNIAIWSLAGSKWRQRQPWSIMYGDGGLSKRKVGLGRIALNFTSSLSQEYSGRVDLKPIIQRGLDLPHLWKTELQLQLFVGNNWCENNSFGLLLNFDKIRMSHFKFSKYTVLVYWFEMIFQKFARICCKPFNMGTLKIISKHLTRCSVWIGTNFMLSFSFALLFWVNKKVEEKGLKEKFLLLSPIQVKNSLYNSNAHDTEKTRAKLFFAVTVLGRALILRRVKRSSTLRIQNRPLNRWRKRNEIS